jgi:predicted small secreted protein
MKASTIALLAIVFAAFAFVLTSCGTTTMATYGTALNGIYAPVPPYYYAYQPQPWHSQYTVPRVSCVFQGNTEVCRPI